MKETLDNYFTRIYEARITARSPLSLHNRNKKSNSQTTNPRYLEDFHITISDLIIFYYVTLVLKKCKNFHKVELEAKYHLVCAWYNNMKLDENVRKYFLKELKPADDFQLSDQNEPKIDKIDSKKPIEM